MTVLEARDALTACGGSSSNPVVPAAATAAPAAVALTSTFKQTAPGAFNLTTVAYASNADPTQSHSNVAITYSPPVGATSCVQSLQIDQNPVVTPGASAVDGAAALGSFVEVTPGVTGSTVATWVTCGSTKSAIYSATYQR